MDKGQTNKALGILRDLHEKAFINLSAGISRRTANRVSILKDYLTVSLALLGGSLTLLTVKPELVKTLGLLYFGAAIVIIETILNLITRRHLTRHEEKEIEKIHGVYLDAFSAMTKVDLAQDEQKDAELKTALEIKYGATKGPGKFFNNADIYLGWILIAGTTCIVVALLVKFTATIQ